MAQTYRILLVDDEPSIVKMVGKRLQVEGFEVVEALNGEEALAKAKAQRMDLIILDLMMPRMDGYEVCRRLRQDATYQQIPIVILSAKSHKSDVERAMATGASAYVRKPFRAQEMLSTIRSLLSPEAAH